MPTPPFLVSYSITRKCNLKCKHCYSDATEEFASDELSTMEAKKLLDDIVSLGVRLLILDGGEPLCRDDFYEVAGYASSRGIRVVVGSNGTLIDENTARRMVSVGVGCVAISLDGANPETHDSFRGEKDAFSKAIEGVKACRKAGLPFQFNIVARKPVIDELPDILKLALNYGAEAIEIFDLIQVSRVKNRCYDEVLSINERRRIMEWLAETQRNYPIIIRTPACPMYPLMLKERNILPKYFPHQALRRIPYYDRGCAAGMPNGYITILSNGDVIPCMLLQVKIGNVRMENIVKIWNESPILSTLRARENLLKGRCGECRYKGICAGCRGRAFEETGDIMAEDPGCWL
ncbi:MAG: radical SAM protein [Candidatus Methanomethylicia archaeon]